MVTTCRHRRDLNFQILQYYNYQISHRLFGWHATFELSSIQPQSDAYNYLQYEFVAMNADIATKAIEVPCKWTQKFDAYRNMMTVILYLLMTLFPNHKGNFSLTFWSDEMSLNASVTCSEVAPPPTSRKLAGLPPCSLMMSIVDIARPAPFTVKRSKYASGQSSKIRCRASIIDKTTYLQLNPC